MKTALINTTTILLLTLFLSSCGFKMKGANNQNLSGFSAAVAQIKINAPVASNVTDQLRQRFAIQGTNPNAIIAINILDERLESKVVSYDNNSEPNVYEVKISLSYEIAKFRDRVKVVLFNEQIENLDYLFIDDGDGQSEVNREKMKELIEQLAGSLSEKVYSQVINQMDKNSANK